VNADAAADFLAGLAYSVPSLPRAACRGRAALFTSDEQGDVAEAIEICGGCAELDGCRRWAAAQPPRTLTGVIAGRLHKYDFKTKKESKS
jgi:hypothetical protein